MSTTYLDNVQCPLGHEFTVRRRLTSAGYVVATRCPKCQKAYNLMAGPAPDGATKVSLRKLLERDIEARLVKRVFELGGEVRKVQWVGRNSAPDRIAMLPPRVIRRESAVCKGVMVLAADGGGECIWVELKAPGKAATFPKTAHEQAQHREHERMRKMGQRVEVVDSYERIEEILK